MNILIQIVIILILLSASIYGLSVSIPKIRVLTKLIDHAQDSINRVDKTDTEFINVQKDLIEKYSNQREKWLGLAIPSGLVVLASIGWSGWLAYTRRKLTNQSKR